MYQSGGGGYTYQQSPQVDVNWISEAWQLFKAQPGAWVGGLLLSGLIQFLIGIVLLLGTGMWGFYQTLFSTAFTHGMTSPATPFNPTAFQNPYSMPGIWVFQPAIMCSTMVLKGGLYRMAYRQVHGEIIQATDFISIGDAVLSLAGYGLIWGIVTLIGGYLCSIPTLILAGLWLVAPVAIIAEGLNPIQAIGRSMELIKGQWLSAILIILAFALVYLAGFCACVVGLLAAYPIFYLTPAIGYVRLMSNVYTSGSGQPVAGAWPPAPGSQQMPYGQQFPYGQPPAQPYGEQQPYGGPQPPYGQQPFVQPPTPPGQQPTFGQPPVTPFPPQTQIPPDQPSDEPPREPRLPRPPIDTGP